MDRLIQLDPSAATPLYRQVHDALQVSILEGAFQDRRVPSIRELSEALGISRNTVELAYQQLVVAGYIVSKPRSGFVVNSEVTQVLRSDARHAKAPSRKVDWAAFGRGKLAVEGIIDEFHPHDWFRYPYPFAGGNVQVSTFPSREWMRSLRKALDVPHRTASLQDSPLEDDELLIDQIRRVILPGRGIAAQPEEVLVTIGTQHAMWLLMTLLVDRELPVALENPGVA